MRLGGVVCALFGLFLVSPGEAREFRASELYPADYPSVQAIVQLDKMIRQRSEGRHGITMYGRDEGSRSADVVAAVREGRLDLARVQLSALDPDSAAALVPSLPFLFRSTAHLRQVLDGPIGEEMLAGLQAQGLIGLCFYDTGPRSFYSVKRPVKTVADLKGLKVRVQQTPAWSALMRSLGAEPQVVPFERIYADLESGAVDAVDNNWPTYVVSRHYNAAKYFSPTEHSLVPTVLIFSKQTWDGLSRDEQVLLRGVARDSVAHARRLGDEYEAGARRTVEAAGAELVTEIDRKSFVDAMLPLYPTVLPDSNLRSMVRRIQSED
jgi:tripartite ATP-independent transporter DctP family solute receptor